MTEQSIELQQEEIDAASSAVSGLDFVDEMATSQVVGEWFKIGLWTVGPPATVGREAGVVERQAVLVETDAFAGLFDRLGPIGNTLGGMGAPAFLENFEGDQPT